MEVLFILTMETLGAPLNFILLSLLVYRMGIEIKVLGKCIMKQRFIFQCPDYPYFNY